jgi:hypothetical protein
MVQTWLSDFFGLSLGRHRAAWWWVRSRA